MAPCCKAAIKAAIKDIESFWDEEKGSNLKTKLRLSYKKMQRMIRGVGQTFNETTGRYTPAIMQSCGLEFPQMSANSSVRAVRKFRGELTIGFGINVDKLGSEEVTTAYVDLLPLVERKIWDIRDSLDLTSPVCLQSITDSAEVFRRVKQTTCCVKIVRHDGVDNNKPLANNPVLLYEGKFYMKVIHLIHESYNCAPCLHTQVNYCA